MTKLPGPSGGARASEATGRAQAWIAARLWRRTILSAMAGVMIAISFPSVAFEPVIFIAFAPLILSVVLSRSTREAFAQATLATTVAWLINLPWVIKVMSYYGGLPYPLGVAIYIVLAVALGLFAGVFFGIVVHRLRVGSSTLLWLLIPLAWVTVEYARTWLLSGFPWHLAAAATIDLPPVIQIDRLIGPYALGFLILLSSTLLAWLLAGGATIRRRWSAIGLYALAVGIWLGYGFLHLREERMRIASEHTTRAALLQPNISQQTRWNSANTGELFLEMMRMTDQAIASGAKVIIWPESSVPLTYFTTDIFRDAVEAASREGGVDIILGSVAEDRADPAKLWNAAYLVHDGKTVGRYDKIRLVPFGEYVPLRKLLFFADKLVRAVGQFQFGTNDHPLDGDFRYGPAICYEVVYPQITAQQVRNGANVLVTITNDGWYSGTAAPEQHMYQARLRAVEADRYLLRAGTTGISAWIDPTGRIVESLAEGRKGIIYAEFAPRESMTPYVRFGDWFAMAAVTIIAIALMARWRKA